MADDYRSRLAFVRISYDIIEDLICGRSMFCESSAPQDLEVVQAVWSDGPCIKLVCRSREFRPLEEAEQVPDFNPVFKRRP